MRYLLVKYMHSKVAQQWHLKVGHPGVEVSGAGLAVGSKAVGVP